MPTLEGIAASPGIAIGPAFCFHSFELKFNQKTISAIEPELDRFRIALDTASKQIESIKEKALSEAGEEEAEIFEAHAMFLDDPALVGEVRSKIKSTRCNAEWALDQVVKALTAQLESLEEEYFRARAADVRDVGARVMRVLLGLPESDLSQLRKPSIILARDLTPSDTVRLEKSLVLGFATAEGGPTAHTAILAKALALPAVVGVGPELMDVPSGQEIGLDGIRGLVILEPDANTKEDLMDRGSQYLSESIEVQSLAHEPAVTIDGISVEVVANIGNLDDARRALEAGAEGIGLLRTEFLYLDRDTAPSEVEQLRAYRDILEVMGERPVVVRTLDVGGDKELPYLDLGIEANPFLGWRAIRMCLDRPEFFKIQLRALLRASPDHDLRIMFPMIATLEEVRSAKSLLVQASDEIKAEGHGIADRLQTGIMVEIPSVAVLADQFAREVDFFSIGTNDLTQYTMAAERTNDRVAHLGDAIHPAILRQIQRVIEAAHENGIWVGLCGELAGDPEAIPILLGLGLDEFSMAPASIPRAKAIIRRWSVKDAIILAQEAINLDTASAVRELARPADERQHEA